jgi:hypothetical protein
VFQYIPLASVFRRCKISDDKIDEQLFYGTALLI